MKRLNLLLLGCIISLFNMMAQKQTASYSVSCVAFYNLENLFDTINDPTINDEEFLPQGGYHWSALKYENKLRNMAYAISQIGKNVSPVG